MSRRNQLLQMLRDSPNDAFLQYALAMEDRSAGEDEAALAGLRRVLNADRSYVAAYFMQGQILAGLGRYDDARAILQDGIAVAKTTGDAHAAGEMTELLASLP